MVHTPILVDEIMNALQITKGKTFIDATMNGGGHTKAMLKHMHNTGTVLGIDRDADLIHRIKKENVNGLIAEEGNYVDMEKFSKKNNLTHINGILFDLGMSSWHVDSSNRGFSFNKDEVLDMRYSKKDTETTAAYLINTLREKELAEMFKSFGEEPRAHLIAKAIVQERKTKRILTTEHLASLIKRIVPKTRIHPATKVFQALRIAVNRELEAVELGIKAAMRLVAHNGRIAVIAFHSEEDRIVKNLFRSHGHMITKKPILPTRAEIKSNPRARSAKLRIWENV